MRARPLRKVQGIFWLLIAVLLPVAVLPLFRLVHWAHDRLIVGAALASILMAIVWRAWMIRRLQHVEVLAAQQRYAELKRDLLTLGRSVSVNGSSGLWLVATFGAFALLMTLSGTMHGAVLAIGASLMTLLFAASLLVWLPAAGKPVLTLTHDGVQPAGYGLVPWSAIQGIELATATTRGGDVHLLNLFVPDLNERLHEAHGLIRLLRTALPARRLGNVISIRLRNTSEPVHVIERLCRDLWKTATGRDHRWSVHQSAAEAELAQRLAQLNDNRNQAPTLENAQRDLAALRELSDRFKTATEHRHSWTRLATIAIYTFFILWAAQRVVDAVTSFVASDAWLMGSFGLAASVVLIACAWFMRRARSIAGGKLEGKHLAGVVATMAASLVLVLPLTWLLLKDLVGDPISRYGTPEVITVMATKTDSARRGGCDERLSGSLIGDPICLSQAEYARLPQEVPVVLHIRRSQLGYYVESQHIEIKKP